ncbi:MAG: hypothetical protein FJZ87_17330, partial [Chloroflexi bacterium]|nr:hypothetical protein [Chloroflexota bacterium]
RNLRMGQPMRFQPQRVHAALDERSQMPVAMIVQLFQNLGREFKLDRHRQNHTRGYASLSQKPQFVPALGIHDSSDGPGRSRTDNRAVMSRATAFAAPFGFAKGHDLGVFCAILKGRVVFAGQRTRKAIRAWVKERGNSGGALFTTQSGGRWHYQSLRAMILRRARDAGIDAPELHAFRRGFALAMLRDGCDIVTLSRLMGHSDLSLIRRHTKQSSDDLREAAEKHSPADRL